MPTQNYGDQLPAGTLPGSQAYMDNAQQGYAASQAAPRAQALKQLQSSYTSRGLQNSGLAGMAQLGERQGFENEDASFRQQLGQKSAGIAENQREAQQQRGWQVEDRDFAAQHYKDMIDQQNQRADAQRASQLIGGIAGTAGTVIGGIYGGPAGAAALGKAGSSLGDAFAPSDAELSSLGSYQPNVSYHSPYAYGG